MVGRTITDLRLEQDDDGGDFDRLVLVTDKGEVRIRSMDYEGYRSWLRLEEAKPPDSVRPSG